MDARSWGGTLTTSDHKLVTADFVFQHLHRLRFRPRTPPGPKLSLARDRFIHDDEAHAKYNQALQEAIDGTNDPDATPVATQWSSLLSCIKTTAESTVGYRTLPSTKHRYDDPVLAELSARQRELQLRIYNDLKANTKNLRRERNAILHQIRLRCRDIATKLIDEKIQRIENLSGAAQMFEAVRDVTRLRTQPTVLLDDKGKYILDKKTTNARITKHFKDQFFIDSRPEIDADTTAKALDNPITAAEFRLTLRRLNNGRASGPDDIPAELLKYGADVIASKLAALVNASFARGEPLELGEGVLLCLPKPNKPRGQCSSLRPIVLLNSIRKAISLIVLVDRIPRQ